MQWLLAVLDAPGELVIVVASSFIDGLAISKVSGAVECCELDFRRQSALRTAGRDFAQDICGPVS